MESVNKMDANCKIEKLLKYLILHNCYAGSEHVKCEHSKVFHCCEKVALS